MSCVQSDVAALAKPLTRFPYLARWPLPNHKVRFVTHKFARLEQGCSLARGLLSAQGPK